MMSVMNGGMEWFVWVVVAMVVGGTISTIAKSRRHNAATDLRVCKRCGQNHPQMARFCRQCGRQL